MKAAKVEERLNTVLGLCLARAVATWGKSPTRWAAIRVTPRASRVAGFVVLWAVLLSEGECDSISIEDYAVAGLDSRRTAYRRLADFRELFPAEADPNRIACLVRDAAPLGDFEPSPLVEVAV